MKVVFTYSRAARDVPAFSVSIVQSKDVIMLAFEPEYSERRERTDKVSQSVFSRSPSRNGLRICILYQTPNQRARVASAAAGSFVHWQITLVTSGWRYGHNGDYTE